jgi:HEAT repeat protein
VPADDFPLLVTATPEDVQRVVGFCTAAERSQLPGLRRAALESPDPLVVGNALRALGRLRAVAGDAELVALLDDPRARVRHETIVALGHSGEASAVPRLAPVLEGEDPAARQLALQALGRLDDPAARAVLEGYAPRDTAEEPFLRQALAASRTAGSAGR